MGANLQILDQKPPGATLLAVFDFVSALPPASTATLTGGTVTATVWTGVDGAPQAVVSGAATVSGTKLTQRLTGGIAGVVYKLRISATTTDGQTLAMTAYLAVVEDPL